MSSADIVTLPGGMPRPLRQIALFLAVGSCGLAVDAGLFSLLAAAGMAEAAARAASIAAATLATWRLNRLITFRRSGRREPAEGGWYVLVAAGAQGLSYAVFLGLRTGWPDLPALVALMAGAVLATGFSFTGQKVVTSRDGDWQ